MQRILPAILLGLAASAVLAQAQSATAAPAPKPTLYPGAKAPKIEVKNWVKGTPVKEFAANKTYVVEFWATWCGPCIETIPHLSKLAAQHKDVTFVGVSIWEDGTAVPEFVKKMGDKMSYNVAFGGEQEGMAQTWMAAAMQNGIPTAFVVKDQVVQWIGHPAEIDEPLKNVVDGKHDVAETKKKFDALIEAEIKSAQAANEIVQIRKAYENGKQAEAKERLTKLVSENPSMEMNASMLRLVWQAQEDLPGFNAKIDEMLKQKEEGIGQVMMVAGQLVASDRTQPIAAGVIDKALTSTKREDVYVLYMAVNVFRDAKMLDKSRSAATDALKVFPKSPYKDNANLKKFFEEAAKAKDPSGR